MMPSEIRRRRPIGATWRRTSSGLSTTSASGGADVGFERLPGALQQQRVALRERLARRQVVVLAVDREHHEVAARRHHAGEEPLADQRRARRDDDLGEARGGGEEAGLELHPLGVGRAQHQPAASSAPPRRRRARPEVARLDRSEPRRAAARRLLQRQERQPGRPPRSNPARGWPTSGDPARTRSWCTPSSSRNCSTRVRACRLRSAAATGSRAPAAGASRAARRWHGAEHQEHADIGELEVAEAVSPGLERGLEHQHVHRRAGQRQHRAGVRRRRRAA